MMARRKAPILPDALLDQLLAGTDARSALDPGGLLDGLKKALTERALNAEMDHHLSGEDEAENRRNGYGAKTVLTDSSKLAIDVPRDRAATFDPQLIAKYQRRFPGFDEKIVSMYARGMSTREITGHLRDLYGIEVSADLISTVTDAVLDEVAAWQMRPLESVYPLIFFDALRVKIRDESLVRNKAVHIALGVRADGAKEILGMWIEQNEGAKFWHERAQEPWPRRCAAGCRRWPQGLFRGNFGSLSGGADPNLYRSSPAQQLGLRLLRRPESRRN
jgi:putative transposase